MNRNTGDRRGVIPARRDVLKLAGAGAAASLAGVLPRAAWAQKPGVLRVGLSARDMGLLHPHIATGSNDTPVIDAIFSGLLSYAPGKVSIEAIEPDLAESWKASDDRKTYTFNLRKGAKWHRGYGEVTSADVKYSLEWVRDNPRSTFRPIYANIAHIETPDPYTVIVSLKNANPVFLISVTNWHGGYVICKKAMEELGDKYKSEPVGSGPFAFSAYRPKESVTLTANADYFFGKPKLDQVVFSYIPDETSRRFAFVRQEVDIIQGQPAEDWLSEVVKATPGKPVVDLLGPTRLVAIHMKKSVKPLDNLKVRQAIAHAINRDDYVHFFGRVFSPIYAPVPPEYFGSIPADKVPADLRYEFDIAKAKKLLAEAGHPNGFKLETVVSERTDYLNLAQIAKEQLAQIGIDLKLNVMDHGSWIAAIIKDKKGSLVWSTASRFPSADTLLREFWLCAADVTKPTGVQGFAEYCNPAFDAAYQAGVQAFAPAERARHFEEAELIELKDLPSFSFGAMATPALRQGYVKLGYDLAKGERMLSLPYCYRITHETSV